MGCESCQMNAQYYNLTMYFKRDSDILKVQTNKNWFNAHLDPCKYFYFQCPDKGCLIYTINLKSMNMQCDCLWCAHQAFSQKIFIRALHITYMSNALMKVI